MEMGKHPITLCEILRATSPNQEWLERIANLTGDVQRSKREAESVCRCCWYLRGRIGGATCSSRPCGGQGCSETLHSGNTCVDVACLKCALRYGICRRCGGDINDKNRTKLERGGKTRRGKQGEKAGAGRSAAAEEDDEAAMA